MSPLTFGDEILRLVVAMVLGVIIGLERQANGKDAGIRTMMLVAEGAVLFTMISIMTPFCMKVDMTKLALLPDRVVANIVVGVGFLGGAIIIKSGEHVKGLTTAALVWATAAIGILVGFGMFDLAVTATTLNTGSLYLLRKFKIHEHVRPANGYGENGGGK